MTTSPSGLFALVDEIYLRADRRRHWMRENGLLNWPDGTRSPRTNAPIGIPREKP